jgi:hypothetical protein
MHYYKYDVLKFHLPYEVQTKVQVEINQQIGAVGNTKVELKLLEDLTSSDKAVFAEY